MRINALLWVSIVATLIPVSSHAQTPRRGGVTPELIGSVAYGRLFRVEDRTFGNELNLGAGIGFRRARLGVEFDVNNMFGLSAEPARCGVATCIGSARSGVIAATIGSANVLYHFSEARVQPYVAGGVGAMWTRSVASVLTVRSNQGTFTEREGRDTGLAINFGAGLRIAVRESLFIRPEFRLYEAVVMSRQNLSLARFAVAVGYRF